MISPQEDPYYSHFQRMPWCLSLMNSPDYSWRRFSSLFAKERKEDTFFSEALRAEGMIEAAIAFQSRPKPRPGLSPAIQEVWALFSIGVGLNGHPGILHGGVVASLFDEVMGMIIGSNQTLEPPAIPRISSSTAYLNTTYLKHIPTPTTVLVSAILTKSEGRKHFVEATMEDEHGTKLARAEALFVVLKGNL